jgi:hypothetical protein
MRDYASSTVRGIASGPRRLSVAFAEQRSVSMIKSGPKAMTKKGFRAGRRKRAISVMVRSG